MSKASRDAARRYEDDPCAEPANQPLAAGRGAQGRLIPVEVALSRGLALAAPVLGTVSAPLTASFGRVLAEPAVSPAPLPPFDNSAMDGYALARADLAGPGPWRLRVAATVAAGEPGDGGRQAGEAVRIFTGAPLPPGCDAVVMQERAERSGAHVLVRERPAYGANIRRAGEDLGPGDAILRAGAVIGPREAAALAAVGAARVAVRRQVRVALFCSGSELRDPGQPLARGQIWNANRYALLAALQAPWVETSDLGVVPDDPAALAEALASASGYDLIVSTGGVSVGDKDLMSDVFRGAGGEVHAMRLAMKPGKPIVLGKLGGAIFVGLPGNPVAAFVTWKVIGDRILRKLSGQPAAGPAPERVRAAFELSRKPGRREYRPATLVGTQADGARRVELLTPTFSARIAILAEADGLAILPAGAERVERGDPLDFLPL